MARELLNKKIDKGIYNSPNLELIPSGAASNSEGFLTTIKGIELVLGKQRVGDLATGAGSILDLKFGYNPTGTSVLFKQTNSAVQYYDTADSTWKNSITGLTAAKKGTLVSVVGLAGNFMFFFSQDGIWKIPIANPASPVKMYDELINFKGNALYDAGRTLLWNREKDLTGLYLSHIDEANYTTVSEEDIGTGDGADTDFSDTLAFKSSDQRRTCFGIEVKVPVAAGSTISSITSETQAVLNVVGHSFEVGDTIYVENVSGMTEFNGLYATVVEIESVDYVRVNIDSTGFSSYTSGGNARLCEVITDDLDGTLSSEEGGTGTINYATGAISVDFNTAPLSGYTVHCDYQWENSNNGGVTDFTYSATRVAGEGDVFRQDEGGDAILQVHALEGSYFSFKQDRIYKLTLSDDDSTANNRVFRTGIGIPSKGASTPTSSGIVFMNTFNKENPELNILERNLTGDNFNTRNITPQFDYSGYNFDECEMETFGNYVVFSAKTAGATSNDVIFMVNLKINNAVSVLPYHADSFAKDDGNLYIGDSLSDNVYQVLSGYDDDGHAIDAFWEGNQEDFGSENLKRIRKVRFGGLISKSQSFLIQVSYDNGDWENVGTIEGDGSYVDTSNPYLIGSEMIGSSLIGGDGSAEAYSYLREFKINSPKFRKRTWRIVPQDLGYLSLEMIHDLDILLYSPKLPNKYRT